MESLLQSFLPGGLDLNIFVSVVGMESREGGRWLRYDIPPRGSGVSPGGKRRLIRGGGQPPGSVLELDPRTRGWRGAAYGLPGCGHGAAGGSA